jgi:hypothetical protein
MRTRQASKSQKIDALRDVISSRQESPHLRFLNQHVGTLPEVLREADLAVLNAAFGILFDGLREARRQFEQEGDCGRAGAVTALNVLWQFIVLFETAKAHTLEVPLLRLQDALVCLDAGSVQRIVEKRKKHFRGPSSYVHSSLKGHVAGTVRRLVNTGLRSTDARERVARQLKALGVRPDRGGGHVTATTVRNWCNEVSKDVNRDGAASIMYDGMFTEGQRERFSALPETEARRFALMSLSAWVLTYFPELKKLVNPHS